MNNITITTRWNMTFTDCCDRISIILPNIDTLSQQSVKVMFNRGVVVICIPQHQQIHLLPGIISGNLFTQSADQKNLHQELDEKRIPRAHLSLSLYAASERGEGFYCNTHISVSCKLNGAGGKQFAACM